ncbi:hypothetical protein F5Y16DRAFT_374780 [Xylariaceae sp. FL0255]|nr:hypothetical protein F5Y16DRAFT_374780 [Xylariaceae sp. FL0255]
MKVHYEWPPVQAMVEWITQENPMATAPTIHELHVSDLCFSREEANQHSDPFIAVAEVEYHPDTPSKSTPYWKGVVETSRKESGTLAHGVHMHPTDPNKLFAVEVYKSKEYLGDVHAKSDAVRANVEATKDLRKGLKHTFLKNVGGYLYNPESTKL